ncbi:PLP-dependent aminotransferase family protein [Paraburkholderia sp.]|uniref:MocR-like pyridoxine biosynthesis transcription factor PdxR n=1 Tax=Paraburkholderia sp. TaxID=1926495 RepID=UPI0039C8E932
MDLTPLQLNRDRAEPIYLQLYRRYREAIAAGRLQPGDRVPSVRSLASELNLARGTVELAYQMLTSEGYLVARGPAGTVVSHGLEKLAGARPKAARRPAPVARSLAPGTSSTLHPLQMGLPALDAFPHKTWARLAGRAARTLDTAVLGYPDPAGYEPLRREIATYLGISRGIACAAEQVFVTSGYRGALHLISHALLKAGDTGWFEEPGYPIARRYLEHMGMRLKPVPVDDEGLNVSAGIRRANDARFAVLTPTHQSPLGVALSLPRRLELLQWASRQHAWIVEDDYDSEFRYHGRPLPALKSLDRGGRVLYTGTFSKVLFPGLRLAYLVVPEQQVERFQSVAQELAGACPILQQRTVAEFIEQGHFARHLRKMRTLYAARRKCLVDTLSDMFGPRLHVRPQAGGIHVAAYLNDGQDDRPLAAAARERGLAIEPLSGWHMTKTSRSGLLMGFTNVVDARHAQTLASTLKQAFDALAGGRVR